MPKFETSVEFLDPMAEVQETPVEEEENSDDNSVEENASLIAKLLSNPEAAALLKALAKTIQTEKMAIRKGCHFNAQIKP